MGGSAALAGAAVLLLVCRAPMTAGRRRLLPHALLLSMILVWGGSYVAVKSTHDELKSVFGGVLAALALLVVRFWIAVACLLPFLLMRGGAGRALRDCARAGCITGTALASGYLLQTVGMGDTSASTAGLIAGLIPLLVALGGWLFFGARPGRPAMIGFVLGFAGMLVLAWPQGGANDDDRLRGVLLQLGSSTTYAAHILLLSKFGRTADPLAFSTWQLLVVAAFSSLGLLLALLFGEAGDHFVQTLLSHCEPRIVELLYLGVLATAVGIGVQCVVQPRIPPTQVALLFATQPLFAALAGWAFRGDHLRTLQYGGGALIVVGIVVAAFDRARSAPESRDSALQKN